VWGAIVLRYRLPPPILLTAASARTRIIPNNSKVVAATDLSGFEPGLAGVRVQPPGCACGGRVSRADSRVSPVDRLRLLTVPSKLASLNSPDVQTGVTPVPHQPLGFSALLHYNLRRLGGQRPARQAIGACEGPAAAGNENLDLSPGRKERRFVPVVCSGWQRSTLSASPSSAR